MKPSLTRCDPLELTPLERDAVWLAKLTGIFCVAVVVYFAALCAGCNAVSYSPPVMGGAYVETTTIRNGNYTATVEKHLYQGANAKTASTLDTRNDAFSLTGGLSPKELNPADFSKVSLGVSTPPSVTIAPPPDYTKYILIGAGIVITLIGVGLAGASAYPAFILFAPLLRSIGTDFGIFGAALILVGVFTKELEGLVWFLGAGIVIVLLYVAYTKLSAHKATLAASTASKTTTTTATTSTTAPSAPVTPSPASSTSPLASDASAAIAGIKADVAAVAARVDTIIGHQAATNQVAPAVPLTS